MSDNPEEIAEIFESQIRKGFISALILLVLEEEPCHGYGIVKNIEERTLGMWKLQSSTIYPILSKLEQKELIELFQLIDTGKRQSKEYKITEKGAKVLKMLIRRYKKLERNMRSIIVSVFGLDENSVFEDFVYFMPDDPIFGWTKKTDEEKLKNLKYQKVVIEERLALYKRVYQNIQDELEKLEK